MLDKQSIFGILRDQNYWYREIPPTSYIPRKSYLRDINKFIRSKAILVVKGPRRAGKTVLLDQIIRQMVSAGKHKKEQILYVNLEDYRFYNHYSMELLEAILTAYQEYVNPDENIYFFIDEIQHIEGFEHFLRSKYDTVRGPKFIVTGSNARLLSKELGTLLTGRMVSMEVFPFSFEEFLAFHGLEFQNNSYFGLESDQIRIKQMFNRYLRYGAIPEFLDEEEPDVRLTEYFENVLFRDIVERFGIRNIRQIKELALYLLTNSARQYSINQLSRTFKASVNTIQSHLSALNLAYMFFYLRRYSPSFKAQITSRSKAYCLDTGLMNAVGFRFSEDRGALLENLVHLELLRCQEEVYFHRDPSTNKECDFVTKKGLKITRAIQVTRDMRDPGTRKRELAGLLEAAREYGLKDGLILTEDEFDTFTQEGIRIRVRPLWFWLLNKEE